MSVRLRPPDLARDLRGHADRLRRLESGADRRGTFSVRALRIGDYVIEQAGPNLVARSLVSPFTVTTVAVP